MTFAALVLTLVTLQRAAELLYSSRNTRRLLRRGAFEVGARHYPFLVATHSTWLAGLWWLGWDRPVSLFWLGAFLAAQIFRVWIIHTLGERWTTRIIVLPNAPLIGLGPYRFLRHPNYLVVTVEIAVLPLALGLPAYALAFTIINAAVLTVRIRAEDGALGRTQ